MSILSRFLDGIIKSKKRIKKNNDYVLRLLKGGSQMATVSTQATWFPPRPLIKKNVDALGFKMRKTGHLKLV